MDNLPKQQQANNIEKKNIPNPNGGKYKTFGIALGGGGARGMAHIGILDVITQAGIRIDCITGTSAGAIMGALFALGNTPKRMEDAAREFGKVKFVRLRNFNFLRESLLKSKSVGNILDEYVGDATFEDCKIPFTCIAVDIESGKHVEISTGKLKDALMASSAIPGIFPPVFKNNQLLVDGGLINNVPVAALKKHNCDITMGVSITNFASRQTLAAEIFKQYYQPTFKKFLKMETFIGRFKNNLALLMDILLRSLEIATDDSTEYRIRKNPPDILLQPQINVGLLEFAKASDAIAQGRQAMIKELAKLLKILGRKQENR